MGTTTAPAPALQRLLPDVAQEVYRLCKEELDETLIFHGYQHTADVVEAVNKIGRKEELDEETMAPLRVAAWFHDAGFVETYEGHEDVSARIARDFLAERDVPEDAIAEVESLILATRPGHEPQTFKEEVLRDADMAHLGRKKFFERSERLREEWAHHRDKEYTDLEWAQSQLSFLYATDFYTPYAREKYGKRKRKNIKEMRRRIAALLDRQKPVPVPDRDKGIPKRGKETMFRSAYRTHINLSSIADAKANIMISINAILMSIIVSFVSTRAQDDPWLLVPSGVLLISALISIVFAILSARPKVTSEIYTLEDVRRNEANILFFGNFVNLPLETFKLGIREIIHDWDRLYDAMASDLYGLGQVLQKKYRLLWISYTVFMIGLILTVTLLLILFFTAGQGTMM